MESQFGGMEHRPKYLHQIVSQHLMWSKNMTSTEVSGLEYVSIKPMPEDMDNPYPAQLRITVATSEQANLFLMKHSFAEGQFPKKSNKCKIMLLDEFMARYHELSSYVATVLIDANRTNDTEKLREVSALLDTVVDGWTSMPEEVKQ